ncbi:eggshell protein 1-like [Scaptodrosophila lebanonensis]|uniref:Eggshell protein 1-like n=1 Tax=Drosophila lebanonensis TaxID=7225 RepID=A0A6J2UBP7_DROLE|nr:eggshell protein 1-like [Scaptodrosophila lebanonensis]
MRFDLFVLIVGVFYLSPTAGGPVPSYYSDDDSGSGSDDSGGSYDDYGCGDDSDICGGGIDDYGGGIDDYGGGIGDYYGGGIGDYYGGGIGDYGGGYGYDDYATFNSGRTAAKSIEFEKEERKSSTEFYCDDSLSYY